MKPAIVVLWCIMLLIFMVTVTYIVINTFKKNIIVSDGNDALPVQPPRWPSVPNGQSTHIIKQLEKQPEDISESSNSGSVEIPEFIQLREAKQVQYDGASENNKPKGNAWKIRVDGDEVWNWQCDPRNYWASVGEVQYCYDDFKHYPN